jgi:hypothetical protein
MMNPGIIALLLLSVASLSSAQAAHVTRGDRVRFSIGPPDSLHEAVLERVTPDSLVLESCGTCARLLYGRSEIGRLAVFRKSGAGMRAVTGFGLGGLVGLGIAGVAVAGCHGGDKCDGTVVAIPFLGLLGGLIGAVGGYLSGYKWVPVS